MRRTRRSEWEGLSDNDAPPRKSDIAEPRATIPSSATLTAPMAGNFHDDPVSVVVDALRTDPARGISAEEARTRLAQCGPNLLAADEGPSRWDILKGQILSPLVAVLLASAALCLVLRDWVDLGAILAIVVLNATVGYFQEYRAERSLQMLRGLAAPKARVVRGGASELIPAAELVPGDLIELEPGDLVPADCRMVSAAALRMNESALTGESTPVEKTTEPTWDDGASLGDRTSCVYAATSVVGGRGRAVVFATAADTELGKIVSLVKKAEREKTPLQRDLSQVGNTLLIVCGVAIAVVFLLGLLRQISWSDTGAQLKTTDLFLTAVSLAVAAIPEGLPAIVTITLAIGVQRMLKRRALIRRLSSVETLGTASVICADKTGTITRNELSVRGVLVGDARPIAVGDDGRTFFEAAAQMAPDPALRDVLFSAVACSNVRAGSAAKDPTELALVSIARAAGYHEAELEERLPRMRELPFDSIRRRMSTLHESPDGYVLLAKGAHEVILERCTRVQTQGGEAPLSKERAAQVEAAATAFAERGMRVLAIARRSVHRTDIELDLSDLERDLSLLGLVAMADTPRPEALEAVEQCWNAGIRTVLLTGDHVVTAQAIAREVGILRDGERAVTGSDLAAMTEDELTSQVDQIRVYARLAPEQKLHIVRAWKRRGAVVAMTGDGVNDAPAIKEADVGVAMGLSGTDVAREAADLVVTDDNFASIVAAVEEGRGVHANIRRALLCLFAGNLSEVALVGAATALGLPVPLHPTQILWMNLVTDGPPALALATEPVNPDEMRRPPRDRRTRMLDGSTIYNVVYQGFMLYFGAMLSLLYFYDGGRGGAAASARMQTGVFCTVVLSQMLNCLSFRHDEKSLFTTGVRGNLRLAAAIVVSIALQVVIVHWDFVRPISRTVPLTLDEWSAVIGFSLLPVVMVELRKAWLRSRSG